MVGEKRIDGNKFLKFRIDSGTYNLIKKVADELNLSIGEVARRIIAGRILDVMLADNPKTLSELRREFLKKLSVLDSQNHK